jgi:uncharacterized protein YbjT (DUF2867 family)
MDDSDSGANLRQTRDVILITGATGRLGHFAVDELLRSNVRVRSLTRRSDRVRIPAGAEVVRGAA